MTRSSDNQGPWMILMKKTIDVLSGEEETIKKEMKALREKLDGELD